MKFIILSIITLSSLIVRAQLKLQYSFDYSNMDERIKTFSDVENNAYRAQIGIGYRFNKDIKKEFGVGLKFSITQYNGANFSFIERPDPNNPISILYTNSNNLFSTALNNNWFYHRKLNKLIGLYCSLENIFELKRLKKYSLTSNYRNYNNYRFYGSDILIGLSLGYKRTIITPYFRVLSLKNKDENLFYKSSIFTRSTQYDKQVGKAIDFSNPLSIGIQVMHEIF